MASPTTRPVSRAVRVRLQVLFFCGVCCWLFGGCQPPVDPAASLVPASLATRQMQTRLFTAEDEVKVMKACAALLQDYGYHIDISETRLGLLVGFKERGGIKNPLQILRASVVTRPTAKSGAIEVRLAFQRLVLTQQLEVIYREAIYDPKVFRQFFARLSRALTMTAEQL